MSIIRLAVRICVVEALRGRTRVGDNVLDSQFGALDVGADGLARTDQDKPFIAVFTDGGGNSDSTAVRDWFGSTACDLVFDFGIASTMTEIVDEETGEKALWSGIKPTDANLEFELDLLEREIGVAMRDPSNLWVKIFEGLVDSVSDFDRARMSSAGNVRLAAHQLKVGLVLVEDIAPGEAFDADGPFGRFLDQLSADPRAEMRQKGAIISGLATAPVGETWAATMARMGMNSEELLALGLGPLANSEDGSVPVSSQIDIETDTPSGNQIVS